MTTPTPDIDPSGQTESKKDDFQQKLETKLNDANSFRNEINNIEETVTYSKDKKTLNRKRIMKSLKHLPQN